MSCLRLSESMMLLLASVMEVVVAMMEAAGEVGSSWDGDLNRVQKLNSSIYTFRGHYYAMYMAMHYVFYFE